MYRNSPFRYSARVHKYMHINVGGSGQACVAATSPLDRSIGRDSRPELVNRITAVRAGQVQSIDIFFDVRDNGESTES